MRPPLGSHPARVSSPFGPRWGSMHRGIDYAVPEGTPIYAPADGVVVEGKERTAPVSGFGSWIWLDCQRSTGYDLIFGHVQGHRTIVRKGQRVKAGDLIGYTGNEGQSTGPHLHFETWAAPGRLGGKAVDPAPLITEQEGQDMGTIIDTAGGFPSPDAIKKAGHSGHIVYISPDRTKGGLPGKPATRAHVDGLRKAGLDVACVWQFGKDSSSAPPDVMRGRAGGIADAAAADAKLKSLGLDGWPVFFAVDFNITIEQWNKTAVEYFRGAASVLGRDRVGIYGHSKVCHWAGPEDRVVAEVAPGRFLAWQTPAWSGGKKARDYAVLYQGRLDTPRSPGPRISGIAVDVNDIWHDYWGQRPPKTAAPPKPGGTITMKPNPKWRGDPTFLPDLLRFWGVKVKEYPGWKSRGQGDFADIQGIIVHHTAASNTPPSIIAHGHSALRGLLSQIHLSPTGVATMCGVGIAYHAGKADPGRGGPAGDKYVTRNSVKGPTVYTSGNARYIGIEAQHSGRPGVPWPEAQMEAYVKICAAICWFFGWGTDRVIAHKEYAPSRKVDPSFGMEGFRRRVQVLLDEGPPSIPKPPTPPVTPEPPITEENAVLDHQITSLINPAVKLPVGTVFALLDAYAWKAANGQRAIIANQKAINENLRALMTGLDLPSSELPVQDYDAFIQKAVENDRNPKK